MHQYTMHRCELGDWYGYHGYHNTSPQKALVVSMGGWYIHQYHTMRLVHCTMHQCELGDCYGWYFHMGITIPPTKTVGILMAVGSIPRTQLKWNSSDGQCPLGTNPPTFTMEKGVVRYLWGWTIWRCLHAIARVSWVLYGCGSEGCEVLTSDLTGGGDGIG